MFAIEIMTTSNSERHGRKRADNSHFVLVCPDFREGWHGDETRRCKITARG